MYWIHCISHCTRCALSFPVSLYFSFCNWLTLPLRNWLQEKEPRPKTFLQRLVVTALFLHIYVVVDLLFIIIIYSYLILIYNKGTFFTQIHDYKAPAYKSLTRFTQDACLQVHGYTVTVQGAPLQRVKTLPYKIYTRRVLTSTRLT